MKKLLLLFATISVFFFSSCIFDFGSSGGKLGGDTDLENNEVGSTFYGSFSVDGQYQNSTTKAEVISNEDGVIEMKFTGKIPEEYLDIFVDYGYVDEEGNLESTIKLKNSTEGVAYINADGDETVLVRYDDKVGDKWTYKTLGGKKLEREVISKSTEDDYMWSFMMIKVIEVEQSMPYPGITKSVIRANHKWGVVSYELVLEDGQVLTLNF